MRKPPDKTREAARLHNRTALENQLADTNIVPDSTTPCWMSCSPSCSYRCPSGNTMLAENISFLTVSAVR